MENIFDSIVIGGGPAGLSALLYLSRGLTKSKLIEKKGVGGQIITTSHVDNYLGFPSISAFDLAQAMQNHVEVFAPNGIEYDEVDSIIDIDKKIKTIKTFDGNEIKTKTIILAMGGNTRKLEVKGEDDFLGRGISYCATCDGAFYKNLEVAVVGGGDSAFDEAHFLTRFVSKIYLIHRRKEFRAGELLVKMLRETGKVEFILDSVIDEIYGEKKVLGVKIKNVLTGEMSDKKLGGVFVFIGQDPATKWLQDTGIALDKEGFIVTDKSMATNIDGVFACGDIIEKPVRQIANAVGEGAVAASEAIKYIGRLEI